MSAGAPMHGDLIPTGETDPFDGFDGTTPIGGHSTAPTYYDDEYKAVKTRHQCPYIEHRIVDPLTQQTIVLWQDNSWRVSQIFTGSMSRWGDSAIALEPMSGLADAFNNHDQLTILSGGELWDGEFGIYLQA